MKKLLALLVLLSVILFTGENAYSQAGTDIYWKGIVTISNDTLKITLQARTTNGAMYTLSSATIRVLWNYDVTKITKIPSTTAAMRFPDITTAKGYNAPIRSFLRVGNDSLYQIGIVGPNVGASGDPITEGDSGFAITPYFRDIGYLYWRIKNPSASINFRFDHTFTDAMPAAKFQRFMNFPSGEPTVGLTVNGEQIGETPLPVQLAGFSASIENKRDVKLTWKTTQEINNSGFDIERKTQDGLWSKIGYIQGKGTTSEATTYNFEDRRLNTGKYNYRLKQIDNNGNFEYYELSGAVEVGVPTKYDLSQNYPNPFNPVTKIDYDIPYDGFVKIVLYDITGREVANLVNEQHKAGYYTVQFNAVKLSSGTYFYRMIANGSGNDNVFTKKMVVIK